MSAEAELPRRTEWFINGFRWYAAHYVRKHFHAVRLSRGSAALPESKRPFLVVMNHPSWWDPMIAVILSRDFLQRAHFAPIEQQMLDRYRFFRKLGFFGVEPGTSRGAVTFLRIAKRIMAEPNAMLWVTAQGEFRDVRRRPLELRPGVGFLAREVEQGYVLPLALEYTFWEERTPEALLRWGEPIDLAEDPGRDGRAWTMRIEGALTDVQDALAEDTMSRDPARFSVLLSGKVGVGGAYDWWRRLMAWARGRRFEGGHGSGPDKEALPRR